MKLAALSLLTLACAHAPAPPAADLGAGDHSTPIDGVPLHYHVAGSGPRCLVIPGGPGLEWRYLRMPLLEKRLTLIYVEPIGSGASGRLPAGQFYSVARAAEQMDELRARLGLGRACVIGHSYGAFVAEQLAVTHPDHLSTLVIYGGLLHQGGEWIEEMMANLKWFEDAPWYTEASKTLLEEEAKTDAEATATWHKILPFYFADYDAHREAYDAAAGVDVSAAPTAQRDPNAAPFDVRAQLGKVLALTLVVVGQKDFITPVSQARALARGIMGAQLEVFEKSGHMIHLEEPERFAQVVGDFVIRASR